VSDIVGKIKANTSREMRKRFPWIKKIDWRNGLWSVGFFSSTVGVNEDVIKRYVEFQEKVDTGKVQLDFGFEVPKATGVSPWVSTSHGFVLLQTTIN
jgi:transposase IS200 family protein